MIPKPPRPISLAKARRTSAQADSPERPAVDTDCIARDDLLSISKFPRIQARQLALWQAEIQRHLTVPRCRLMSFKASGGLDHNLDQDLVTR